MENEDIEKPPNGSAKYGTLPANLLDKLKNQKTMTSSEVQAMYATFSGLRSTFANMGWSWTTGSGPAVPSPLTGFLNLWDTIIPNISTSDPQNARNLMRVVISELKAIIDYLNELDTNNNNSSTLTTLNNLLKTLSDLDPDLDYDMACKTTHRVLHLLKQLII